MLCFIFDSNSAVSFFLFELSTVNTREMCLFLRFWKKSIRNYMSKFIKISKLSIKIRKRFSEVYYIFVNYFSFYLFFSIGNSEASCLWTPDKNILRLWQNHPIYYNIVVFPLLRSPIISIQISFYYLWLNKYNIFLITLFFPIFS